MGNTDSPMLLVVALVLFFSMGVALILIAYVVWQRKRALLRTGQRTTGLIVGVEQNFRWQDGERIHTLAPTIRFTLPDGKLVQFTSVTATYPTNFREGQSVQVVYDPSASASGQPPYRATIVSFWQLWTAPILVLALGLGSVLFTAAFALLVVQHGMH